MKITNIFFVAVIAAFVFSSSYAAAQPKYYNAAEAEAPEEEAAQSEGPKMFVVTSIKKCYAELGREAALDIQKNFIKPYQECQRRLAIKLKEKASAQAKEKKGEAKEAGTEKPRNFYRVQQEGAAEKGQKQPVKTLSEEKPLPEN